MSETDSVGIDEPVDFTRSRYTINKPRLDLTGTVKTSSSLIIDFTYAVTIPSSFIFVDSYSKLLNGVIQGGVLLAVTCMPRVVILFS